MIVHDLTCLLVSPSNVKEEIPDNDQEKGGEKEPSEPANEDAAEMVCVTGAYLHCLY